MSRNCPRCRGYLFLNLDLTGGCLNCGHVIYGGATMDARTARRDSELGRLISPQLPVYKGA